MRLCVILWFTGCLARGATLITIPFDDPIQSQSLVEQYNLAINFQGGAAPTIVSSVDIAFDAVPGNLTAALVPGGVFHPLNPPDGAIPAESMSPSTAFPLGLAIEFPDTTISPNSYFSVFFTFSVGGGSFVEGSHADIEDAGVSFHSVIVSDALGNPNSLATVPAMVVSGYVVPEPCGVGLAILGTAGAFVRRRRPNQSNKSE